MNSKNKLNIPQNSKTKEINNIVITPTKLQKYTELYSKHKSYSKTSTKINTNYSSKTKNIIKPSFSLCQLGNFNSNLKNPSLISNFNNSSFFPKTPNKKSRNFHQRFHKNSTIDKKINFDKLCPNIPSLNTQSLMRNTVKSLNFSYKKFFLNKKKIKITSTNKKNNNKSKNKKNNMKSNKVVRLKKYKIAINDEECLNNINNKSNINDKMIKRILELKVIQNKIQCGLGKKSEIFKKKLSNNNNEHIQEFSFNKDYILDNYDENDNKKKYENNNDDIINLVNKNEWCNLIQSNIITSFPEFEMNKRIYEENYECDTPQFTTLNERK